MSRLILLMIGFIAGWLVKDSQWLNSLKTDLAPRKTSSPTIPLHEDDDPKAAPSEAGEVFPDPLEKLKGIGPASKAKLNEQGIYTFAQIATLPPETLNEITGARVKAEVVIEQARELAG